MGICLIKGPSKLNGIPQFDFTGSNTCFLAFLRGHTTILMEADRKTLSNLNDLGNSEISSKKIIYEKNDIFCINILFLKPNTSAKKLQIDISWHIEIIIADSN